MVWLAEHGHCLPQAPAGHFKEVCGCLRGSRKDWVNGSQKHSSDAFFMQRVVLFNPHSVTLR